MAKKNLKKAVAVLNARLKGKTPAQAIEDLKLIGAPQLAEKIEARREVWKPLKSTDPRKAEAMAQLKEQSGCRKITMVEISKDGSRIRGNCMNPGSNAYARTGLMAVDFAATLDDAINDAAGRAAGIPVTDIPAKEKTPARAKALRITCAVDGCHNEPVAGGTHCAEHLILAMKESIDEPSAKPNKPLSVQAQTVCVVPSCRQIIRDDAPFRRCDKHAAEYKAKANRVVKKVEKEINVQLAKPETKKLLAEMTAKPAPAVAPLAPATKAQFFANAPKAEQRTAAKTLTRKLVEIGWSVNAQADATGVTNGSVYRWYRASAAPTPKQFEALEQMLANPPPAKATTAAGSIKAPGSRSQAAKAVKAPKERDVRQLMLELRDALNAQLGAK